MVGDPAGEDRAEHEGSAHRVHEGEVGGAQGGWRQGEHVKDPGDVDALGSVLIVDPGDFLLEGTVEAGGVETFHFITEERGFINGGAERVRIQAPNITLAAGKGYDGADGTKYDLFDEISEGESYPLGAMVVASDLVQLITPGTIDIQNASEVIMRHSDSTLFMQAEYVDILGSLYAGGDPGRVLMGEDPGIDWNTHPAVDAAIEISATEMVSFGGPDLRGGATALDIARGNGTIEGEAIIRGGSAQATGEVTIDVTGGGNPHFYLNEFSFITTDAVMIEEPTPGAQGHITITTGEAACLLFAAHDAGRYAYLELDTTGWRVGQVQDGAATTLCSRTG